ncbi:hypothetical protein, partial [Salmonella enterica subsp. enterica serovar Rissen]
CYPEMRHSPLILPSGFFLLMIRYRVQALLNFSLRHLHLFPVRWR